MKKCGNCNKIYNSKNEFFCSQKCHYEWMKKNIEKHPNYKGGKIEHVCPTCGKLFMSWPHRGNKLFCSRKCKRATPETKAKQRIAMLNNIASGKVRCGQPKGYKPSKETIEKQRAAMKGRVPKNLQSLHEARKLKGKKPKPFCIDCGVQKTTHYGLRCVSCRQSGDRNHRWNGGTSKLQSIIRRSDRNKKWKRLILERDNRTCQECFCKNSNMEVDHIYPLVYLIRDYNIKKLTDAYKVKEFWDINNGQTLCKKCNWEKELKRRRDDVYCKPMSA